ncbi:hypothetical protein DOY81_000675 [Sarcophaga bullata]|nr:hypothetical protein DOY81_000675 [Sarcophaga bullata]
MHCNLPSATPKCALIAKAVKKSQMPVYDTFGPFPDEPIMCSPTVDSERSNYSADTAQKSSCTSMVSTPKTPKEDSIADSKSEGYPSVRCGTPKKSKCKDSRQGKRTLGLPLRALRRSFSLCSLACRKLREKVSFSPSVIKPQVSTHWLLTKLQSHADGCQVYEVFKNSSASTHPSKIDTQKASKLIFVILPSGIIMPFETVPKH